MGDFRNKDGIGRRFGSRKQIVRTPRRFKRVWPNDQLAPAISTVLDHTADFFPRLVLGFRRNRILQVEDQRICSDRLGLFQSPVIGPRHVKNTAAWTDLHQVSPKSKCLMLHRSIDKSPPSATLTNGEPVGELTRIGGPKRTWLRTGEIENYRQNCRI